MIRLRTAILALLTTGLVNTTAFAAKAISLAAKPPPQPGSNQNAPAAWVGMLLMFVIVGAIITISMMPSRREHQQD